MNIPVGETVEENLALKETNLKEKLVELIKKSFSGYLVLTVEGRSGMEEGLVLLKNGLVSGAIYEYIKFNKVFYGESALGQLLNAGLADFGVIDVCGLSKQQIDLIIAFNEKIELAKPLDVKELLKIVPRDYDAKAAEKALGKQFKKEESKFDVFKKLGLGGVG